MRELGLIEGRSPNHFISAKVADAVDQKAQYIHNRGLDDQHYQELVMGYLKRYGQASRADLDGLLRAKLPDVLTEAQKANKVKNLLQIMRRAGVIAPRGKRPEIFWYLGR